MESYEKKQLIYKCILATVFVACITAIITFYSTYSSMDKNYALKINKQATGNQKEDIDTISNALLDFRKLIDQYYIGDIDEQKLLDETIKGYVNGLEDEYSEYMTAQEWEEYSISTLGNYVGIGIYMAQDNMGNILIIEPIEQSPAEQAGLKPKDIIVEVNGESTVNMDSALVATKIKGEAGTKVNLKILRDNQYLTFDVERKEIKVYHVKNQMLQNQIGYIKLSAFDKGCSEEFEKGFNELKQAGAQKLIVDLRDNTGGLVDEALKIADMMIPKGQKMLLTVDSKDKEEITFAQTDAIIDMEMVVLVNEYSASASEILVGALKDNKEATIVGTKTYGKGVIQNVFDLEDGSVLKLTTAEYFTPNKVKINKEGIQPDIEIKDEEQPEAEQQVDEPLNKAIEILIK